VKLTHAAVRDLLETVGPMTMRDLAEFFPGSTQWNVSAVLSSMRTAATKRVYIMEWDRQLVERRVYIRPVYALGDKPDARKPKPMTNAEKLRRSRAKNRIPKVNSVWALGALA